MRLTDWSGCTSLRQLIRKRLAAVFASYRPEQHYMRGPGPKWQEKHVGRRRTES